MNHDVAAAFSTRPVGLAAASIPELATTDRLLANASPAEAAALSATMLETCDIGTAPEVWSGSPGDGHVRRRAALTTCSVAAVE